MHWRRAAGASGASGRNWCKWQVVQVVQVIQVVRRLQVVQAVQVVQGCKMTSLSVPSPHLVDFRPRLPRLQAQSCPSPLGRPSLHAILPAPASEKMGLTKMTKFAVHACSNIGLRYPAHRILVLSLLLLYCIIAVIIIAIITSTISTRLLLLLVL